MEPYLTDFHDIVGQYFVDFHKNKQIYTVYSRVREDRTEEGEQWNGLTEPGSWSCST